MKEQIKTLLNVDGRVQEGNREGIERQHRLKKLTARERIAILLDENSFMEMDKFMGRASLELGESIREESADSVITGYGTIDGRLVYVYAQDFTVDSGGMGERHANKILKIQQMALKMGAPVIGIMDSNGGRIEEGLATLSAYGKLMYQSSISSGIIPQISIVLGPCGGTAAYGPALSDFVFMVDESSHLFLNSPQGQVFGEDKEGIGELGSAIANGEGSGVAHFIDSSEEESIKRVRELLSYLPSNHLENVPKYEPRDDINRVEDRLNEIIPEDYHVFYDIRDIIKMISDEGMFFEISSRFAKNIVVGYMRLNGSTIGVVANQPNVLDGSLDIDSSNKAAGFIKICDSFNIPILNLVDTPGFVMDRDEEYKGVLKHGARMIYAYSNATVPKITLILRRAYGNGYMAMCPRELGADQVFALPIASISIMNPVGAASIIYRDEIGNSMNPISTRQEKASEYKNTIANPYVAARAGYIDDIVIPSQLRPRLIYSFDMLSTKVEDRPYRKHGNLSI